MKGATLLFLLVASLGISTINSAPHKDDLVNSVLSFFNHHHHESEAKPKPDVAAALNAVLTAFKHIIPCGDESLGIPVMAPLRMNHIDVDVSQNLLLINGNIDNLVLAGLGDFLVINLSTNTTSGRTSYDILFKDIQLLGDYNLDIDANLAGYPTVLHMIGLINLQLQEIRLNGAFTVGTNAVGGVLISDMVTYVELGDVVSLTSNYNHSVAVSNFYRRLIEDTLKLYVQTRREAINEQLSSYITDSVNESLYNLSYEDYYQQIAKVVNQWNAITCNA